MGELLGVMLLALLGGVSLGINRALLGKLGMGIGAAGASVVNHIGGALFIFLVLFFTGGRMDLDLLSAAPGYAYLGGIVGALFVAITSWVIPRAGVMKTTVLLISGQMILGTVIDFVRGSTCNPYASIFGLILVLMGVLVGEYRKKARASKSEI